MGTSRTNESLLILFPDLSVLGVIAVLLLSSPICGGWNGNGPHRLLYLNALPPVAGTVWEPLGGVGLLEEMCHRGRL